MSLTKPPAVASALFFLPVDVEEKHRREFRCGREENSGTDGRTRMKRSRRRAARLVLALLGCVGVKLQQLILEVQLVVQLRHLQVTIGTRCR